MLSRNDLLDLRQQIKSSTIDLDELITQLEPDELWQLQFDWWLKARDKQLIPEGDWRWWLLRSGRGFGKTETGAQTTQHMAENCHQYCDDPTPVIVLAGRVMDEVHKQQCQKIIDIAPPWYKPRYGRGGKMLMWPRNEHGQEPQAWLYSGDVKDAARGPNSYWAWLDELASWQYPADAFKNIDLTLRVGKPSRGMITTTPKPLPFMRWLDTQPNTITTVGSTFENNALDEASKESYRRAYAGSRHGRQELEGEILPDISGALFNQAWIDRNRIFMPNQEAFDALLKSMDEISIGVDPHGGESLDEEAARTGIIVGGRKGKIGYCFKDLSTPEGPLAWANKICKAYKDYNCTVVAAEVNYGGKMVKANIHSVNRSVAVREIVSRQGKDIRAEPISTLVEQNMIKHVEIMAETDFTHDRSQFYSLEKQLSEWVKGQPSPDEMDAYVHCFTHLLVTNNDTGILDHYAAQAKSLEPPKTDAEKLSQEQEAYKNFVKSQFR